MDMKYILFREPANILHKMENGMRICEICSPVQVSYTHVWKVVQLLVREGFVTVDENTKNLHRRKYNLTVKGIEVKYHLKELMEAL